MIKIYVIAYWDHWCGYRLKPQANDFHQGDDSAAERVEIVTKRLGLTLDDVEFVMTETPVTITEHSKSVLKREQLQGKK